jgi:hypothetical protein
MGAIIIFGESIFIFNFVIMEWWQSQLGWVHISEVAEKTKC